MDACRIIGEAVILVDGATASSAEIFAALTRRRAGARIVGSRTFGKDHLSHSIPVTHDFALLVPGKRVVVIGESIRGGIVPDGSWAEYARAIPNRCL